MSVVLGGFLEHHGGGWWKMAAFPLPVTIWDDLIFQFRHIGWGHFHGKWPHRKRKMRSSQMVTGSGKAAIFHHPPPWCSKNPPSVLDDVCRTLRLLKNVLQTSASPHDSARPGHTCFSEILWNTFWWRLINSFGDFGSIWSLASPRHCPSDWVSCPLATTGKWSVCTCQHHVPWKIVIHGTWCWLQQAPTLLFFFFFYNFFNCTLQYSRFIEEYSVIVGRNLVWLETNFTPTMTI